jgi:hypothetical protein
VRGVVPRILNTPPAANNSGVLEMKVVIAAAILAWWASTVPTFGATIDSFVHQVDGDDITFVVLEGELNLGDERAFANIAVQADKAVVLMSSPGGNLSAGIAIGKAIRLKGFATLVPEGYTCASACALAWLGGRVRLMAAGATVGFHAASDAVSGDADSAANAIVGAYLDQLGLPLSAIAYITEPKPSDIRWLTFDDAEEIGIDVKRFGDETAGASSPSVEQPAVSHDDWSSYGSWIQILSGPSLAATEARADLYRQRFANLLIFRCRNSWYAAVLGPYAPATARKKRDLLVSSGEIPSDSFVAKGTQLDDLVGGRQPTAVADRPTTDDAQRAISAAVAIQEQWSRPNSEALPYLADLYSADVMYFGRLLPKSSVIQEKVTFALRWPVRQYQIKPGSARATCMALNVCEVKGLLDWYAYSPERNVTSTGSATFDLTVSLSGPTKVLSETSAVITRQKLTGYHLR